MDWESTYYVLGTLFFGSWFVFMTVAVIALIFMMKKMQQAQEELSTRLQAIQDEISAKLNAPTTKVLMTLLPLVPALMSTGRKLWGKK